MTFKYLIMLASLLALPSCGGKREAWYQSAAADQKWDQNQGVIKVFPVDEDVPKYIIENNKLLINIQNVRNRLFYTDVSHPTWNKQEIAALKEKDMVFRQHLPDANDPMGGIRWLTDTPITPPKLP